MKLNEELRKIRRQKHNTIAVSQNRRRKWLFDLQNRKEYNSRLH